MKKISLLVLVLFLSLVHAQNKTPYLNFKNGIGIASPDSAYSINFGFRMQNRALVGGNNDGSLEPDYFEARVRRLRLKLTGHVVNPKLTYYIQLSFSRGDMDWSVTDATNQNVSPNIVRDAMIFYKATKNLQLGFGQTKLPGNRQRVNSSGALQFYDRSLVNVNFTTDRDFGFFANYTIKSNSNWITILKAAATSGEGRNSNTSNFGLAYTGRVDFLPLGTFTDGGDYFEGDVSREPKPKLGFGGGYMLNDMAVRTAGQLGKDLYGEKSFNVYFADLVFKYKGFCFLSEYMRRETENPYVLGTDSKTRLITTGDGINNQISYCFKSMWELALRQTLVSPDKKVIKNFDQQEQYVIGVTKYLNHHKVKAQFNLLYTTSRDLSTQTNKNGNFAAVFQLELGI